MKASVFLDTLRTHIKEQGDFEIIFDAKVLGKQHFRTLQKVFVTELGKSPSLSIGEEVAEADFSNRVKAGFNATPIFVVTN